MSAQELRTDVPDGQADLDTIHEMIQMAYRVAVEPELFSELITTWDRFFANAQDTDLKDVLNGHFEQAERIVNDPRLDRTRNLDAILKLVAVPAILVDEAGILLSGNATGLRVVGLPPGTSVSALFSDGWLPPNTSETHYHRTELSEKTLMAASTFVPVSQDGTNVVLIRLEASQWSAELASTLAETYKLSPTEIETARLLHEGHTLPKVAEIRSRSAETVRTQLKSVLTKTGLRRQTALLQLLSRLQYMVGTQQGNTTAPAAAVNTADFVRREVTTHDGRKLVYSLYGAPNGREVLYLTTSSRPEETPEWRAEAACENLRVTAVHRPGFGGSDAPPGRSPDIGTFAKDCLQCLPSDHQKPVVLAGHREGGILAAQIAPRLSDTLNIRGVCLISTGVPQVDFDDDGHGEGNMKRSVTAVRIFPHALRLGYRAAKRVFEMGPRGEKEIVSYFVKSSPIDKQLLRDPVFWTITRDNIAYCFQQPAMIVDDIKLWSSNWTQDVPRDPRALIPMRFILGADHDFLKAEPIKQFCEASPKYSAIFVKNTAQLMLYQQSRLVAGQVSKIFET